MSGACPVSHSGPGFAVESIERLAFTEAARDHMDTLAQRSKSSGKASAERATKLVENVLVQRDEHKGPHEVMPEFSALKGPSH